MTNRELIQVALRMLGVLDANETASAEDAQLGLDELNDLMSDLLVDGVDLGYVTQTNVSHDFPISDEEAGQIKPLLAMRLLTFFPSQQVPDSLPKRASDSQQRLLRDAVLRNMQEASMANIPLGEAYRDRGDIING